VATLALSLASAQVNVEPLRKELKTDGSRLRVGASFQTLGGNTEGVTAGGLLLGGVRADRHLSYLSLTGDYSRVNDETLVSKAFSHLRYNFELCNWLWAEAFAQLEADRFRRIRRRQLLGIGPRLGAEGQLLAVFYGTSYMPEWTLIDEQVAIDARRTVLAHRWNHYTTVTLTLAERAMLSTTAYYQPRFDEFDDYHLLIVPALAFQVTELLRSGIDAAVRYESRPASDVEELDYAVKNSLALSF
jgi:hypothetical protein